uniref:aralkylamine N-acetyltransferase n=1 Tax=Lygus hesperus TaxID=30085 RepID=A0A0A9Z653_LYGHE
MTITLHSWPPEEWKTEVPEWTIEKCTLGDKEGVYDLLKRAFFKYEPLTCDLTDHPPMDDLFAIKMIDQGHSYKAVLPSGKIVGVVINVHFPDIPDDEEPPTSGRISQVVKFFEFLEKQAELDENGLLELFILAVDPDFRRQGMAKDLGRVSVRYAELSGYRGIKISCTSQYSADAATALGFTLVHSMPYTDYKDEEGNPIFTPALPHTHARIFVKDFDKTK